MAILGYCAERQSCELMSLREITVNVPEQFRVGYVPITESYGGQKIFNNFVIYPDDIWDSVYIRTPSNQSYAAVGIYICADSAATIHRINILDTGEVALRIERGVTSEVRSPQPWVPGEFGCLRFRRYKISASEFIVEVYWNNDKILESIESLGIPDVMLRSQVFNYAYNTAASANGENGVYYGQLRTDSDPRSMTLSVQALRESDLNVWTRQGNFGAQESDFAAAPYTPTNTTSKYYESAVAGYLGIAHRDEVFIGSPVLSAKTTVVARRTTASPNSIKLSDRISYAGEKIDSPVIALTTSFDSYSHTYTPAADTVSAVAGNIEITSV